MPTYEYQCEQCGARFELFQNMNDDPVEKCPECGGKVQRLIGAGAGIIFKGSGFYATDYRKTQPGTTRCGNNRPCCGRGTPCTTPPCDK